MSIIWNDNNGGRARFDVDEANVDGDDEKHSPSDYLNLNQDGNEDDDNIAEGGDGPIAYGDEAEGPSADNDGAEDTSTQVRRVRGPGILPSGRYVITDINDVGDPIRPKASVTKWKRTCGILVGDHVPSLIDFGEKGKKMIGGM